MRGVSSVIPKYSHKEIETVYVNANIEEYVDLVFSLNSNSDRKILMNDYNLFQITATLDTHRGDQWWEEQPETIRHTKLWPNFFYSLIQNKWNAVIAKMPKYQMKSQKQNI